ncbi:MAG: hypothetical protein P8J32_01520 [bacterium]|nr:hypothetical protein [bacterium]
MKIKFHILKIGLEYIREDTSACGKVIIDDNQDYGTKDKLETLRQRVADIYQAKLEDVITELEYELKLLEIAETKRGVLEELYEKQENKTSRDTIRKVKVLDWKSQSNKELGTQKRKITKLRKAYKKQGLWLPELD